MKSKFIENVITYDGTQLSSQWILKQSSLRGDAIISFIGPAHVDLDHLVDLEDVIEQRPIHSESMLHFLVEHFDQDLERMILRQRLLICLMHEELIKANTGRSFVRSGDDLFSKDLKLTVSIATSSPISCLIHSGINISSNNTPVPTMGLNDLNIRPTDFAHSVMKRFGEEMEGIRWARSKVKGVK